jgi:hypothetical protein
MHPTVFLLSPAYCGGRRAAILLRSGSQVPIARRCQAGELTLGEAFSFMSGLYFRGKLTYALAFGETMASTLVITPTRGLQSPHTPVSAEIIREFAGVDISADDDRYRRPLERDVAALADLLPSDARVVLLGSVATGKYVELLSKLLGARLHYPPSFVGRGDMSRGGLLLRQARAAIELDYATLDANATRHGPRPPKLDGPRPVARLTLSPRRRQPRPSSRPAGSPRGRR